MWKYGDPQQAREKKTSVVLLEVSFGISLCGFELKPDGIRQEIAEGRWC